MSTSKKYWAFDYTIDKVYKSVLFHTREVAIEAAEYHYELVKKIGAPFGSRISVEMPEIYEAVLCSDMDRFKALRHKEVLENVKSVLVAMDAQGELELPPVDVEPEVEPVQYV